MSGVNDGVFNVGAYVKVGLYNDGSISWGALMSTVHNVKGFMMWAFHISNSVNH
jgi:hypothetical protein